MKIVISIAVVSSVLMLGGCAEMIAAMEADSKRTAEQIIQMAEASCENNGYQRGTPAFKECRQRTALSIYSYLNQNQGTQQYGCKNTWGRSVPCDSREAEQPVYDTDCSGSRGNWSCSTTKRNW